MTKNNTLMEVIVEYAAKLRIEGAEVADAWLEQGVEEPFIRSIKETVNEDGELIDGDGNVWTLTWKQKS